uniref:Latent-transforming growth factor beta-binding protein 1 n=1 Tax=Oryzias latipes TaxID=8090 RepID=A0A3P9HE69_ORYLA
MAWVRRGLFLCVGLLLFVLCASVERQLSRGGFRRVYVLQPGVAPGPGSAAGDSAVRVSSISTRHGPAGQPHSYNVELSAKLGGQVRTRRMGNQQQQPVAVRQSGAEQNRQLLTLSGVNVCGGQCCHGWSPAQGSQRCTKPNCIPQCQNGGMCLRPQLCVCKPGSNGASCEQTTVQTLPYPALPEGGHTNGNNVVPQRPIPQQVSPSGHGSTSASANNMAQMKLTVKAAPQFVRPHYFQQHIQHQIRPASLQPGQTQKYIIKPKYYHTHSRHTHVQPERPIPLSMGHNPLYAAAAGNHTGRIKVVFTPTICKVTCIGSRCHNNCEKGNTTTIISENGHTTDTLTAPNFRVVVCHLPCINGGKCSARDKCQCPPNFAGKFCQMPVQNGAQQHHQTSGSYSQTQVHSMHTLPLTYSNGKTPGVVNIHINHPPEASVQVHQVSQLDDYHHNGHQQKASQAGSSSSSSYTYHHSESSQKVQHHSYNVVYPNQHGYHVSQYQPVTSKNALGRCFQETAAGQCGKALPGLTKQERCCGVIGTSWGFHKCHKCPNKSSIPLIDCPQGYRKINSSHCQDEDECQLQGVCPNGNCLNTVGSYRCTCSPGFIPDASLTTCIPNAPVVQGEKGACFRLVSSGRQCLHPVSAQLSKQLCCCSVGKAWGPRCDKCPPPGTAQFKEICPGGMGYTVLPNPPANKPVTVPQEPQDLSTPPPLPTPRRPVEIVPVIVENTSPPVPREILPSNAGQDIAPTQSAEVDECQVNPYICGQGICYNTDDGYTCHCDRGYRLDDAQTTCVDVDECQDEQVCIQGHCQNTRGSFFCECGPGFRASSTGDQCEDVDECVEEAAPCGPVGECRNNVGSYSCVCPDGYRRINDTLCRDVDECVEEAELCSPHGRCFNAEGSYICLCESGFSPSLDFLSCEDVNECALNESRCGAHGHCANVPGSFQCLCHEGYQESQDGQSCEDLNECQLLGSVCGEAECVNTDGSFLCECPLGQNYNARVAKCEPISTEPIVERKECYYHLDNENLCESVLKSQTTLQECCCTLGAGWGDNCEVHPCPVNGTDQFNQMCPSGKGFVPSADLLYGIPTSDSYKNADECAMFGQEVCKGGYCKDTTGSYECYCKTGQYYDPVKLECKDINECQDDSLCEGGQCMNTDGSYMCFCTHPMMLDPDTNRCVFAAALTEQHESEQTDFQGICWQTVTDTKMCTRPLGNNRKITYTECCCLHGEAWGMDCALCPPRNTEDYAWMCNVPLGGGRRPYGQDALVAGPIHEYEVSPDYSPSPEHQPAPRFYEREEEPYKAFEGLLAEECGILNGCENGRCVRVQEGYTCDCFDGYTLDLSRMACVDVNECSELNRRMSLCRNAKCINTVGSYQCVCLPGFRASDKPNYCVEADSRQTSTHTQ